MALRLFASLRGYRLDWLPRDLVAGLMLAAVAMPGQIATAHLAGMVPQAGLIAFAAGSLAFAAFGANRFISVGADSTIAPIFAGSLALMAAPASPAYAALAGTLALMVGAILILVGALRAGWLANLLSIPVTTGFLAGIAVHILAAELPGFLGLPSPTGHLLSRLAQLAGELTAANPYALAIGAAVLTITLGTGKISPRIPGALVALVGAGVAVTLFGLQAHGVALLGPLSFDLSAGMLPALPRSHQILDLLPLSLIIAMVCIMQTAAVASAFPSDRNRMEDVSGDFAGVGVGCLLAGLAGGFPVDASPPSTAIVVGAGGRSQAAAIAAVLLMAAVAFAAAKLLAYVPQAALSGILIYIAVKIVRLEEMRRILRRVPREISLVLASAGLVVTLPIETGMLLAIVLSFLHSLYIMARPRCAMLARVPGTTIWWPPSVEEKGEHEPGVLVFAPAAPLHFSNADHICRILLGMIARAPEPVKLLVIEASGIVDFDYTGSQILQKTIDQLRAAGTEVAMARLSDGRAQEAALSSGLIDTLGKNRVFLSVEAAIQSLHHPDSAPSGA